MGKLYNMIRIMDQKKIGVEELAKRIGIHSNSLYRIRSGYRPTTMKTMEAIARELEVEVKDLL